MRAWRGTRRVTVTGASSGCCSARHKARFDLADAFAVGDRRAVFFEHVVQVEAEAVAGRRDARVDDVQARAGRAPPW
jgi:hypothetical protein